MLLVRNLIQYVVSFYPDNLRRKCEREVPRLSVAATRLALEVLDAELNGHRYSDAVRDPSFPTMSRLHFGLGDTLQWRLPDEMIEALRNLLGHAVAGDFDPIRQLVFAVATRRRDPEAALCRFLLWEAIRLNLLVATWDEPAFEARGLLTDAETNAEQVLAELLAVPAMLEDDVRPLHVLVAAAADHLERSASRFNTALERHSHALEEFASRQRVVHVARQLDSRSAAALWPGESQDELGSQRIADRYPHHFPSANAVEAQRTRTVRRLRDKGIPKPSGDRLVDQLREHAMEAQ